MKNISQTIKKETGFQPKSPGMIYRAEKESKVKYWFYGILGALIIVLFLPWTQNINTAGKVTTLYQDQRPQELNSIIPGRIVKWWVKEGDFVKKGDTIVQLLDIKDDYLDPQLLQRTEEQLKAKQKKIVFYNDKIDATQSQVAALEQSRDLKLNSLENKMEQTRRKLLSDSAEAVAAEIDYTIATQQLNRGKQMFSEGVVALTELEKRTAQFNKTQAILTEKQQKFQNTRQDLVILKIEMGNVRQEAADKIFKAQGDIASARGEVATTDGEVAKGTNQLANYVIRGGQRWLIAPQDGQVINARKQGLNETVKEGETIVEIVPNKIDYAVELFVDPMDLVLIDRGQDVRLIFDGFPAIVFSGWPAASYGTFLGEVIAVETNLSSNGKFRILVVPGNEEKKWPPNVKIGAGVRGFAMLKNVSIWYELWRQINGFPPEYYKVATDKKKS
ncbi:MAG: HlyD family efflux transporter periplasmic adaptor subunit [Chitinophagia bacterium]|nr:HlyD family efflux transporter periplasmic adaptor subunit [Chitinophagia bacterium]